MNAPPNSILLVEDTPAQADVILTYLAQAGLEARHVSTGDAALKAIAQERPEAILCDVGLPDIDGLEVLSCATSAAPPIPTVVITANGSINIAVDAMRRGAVDFLVKPFRADRLIQTLNHHLKPMSRPAVGDPTSARGCTHGFIGRSPPLQAVCKVIDRAASSRATVFVTGESGTGKELCAEAIHRMSPRRERPFVALNCAAIPSELMESEFFGHVRGAFTGAHADREGAAAIADGGTLFLDEICELDPGLQTKLLRFLQTGSFQRVGDTRQRRVDLRIVCATNREPMTEVASGRFREDLFYRLHVIPIHLPPLRERGDDAIEIARSLVAAYAEEEAKPFDGLSEDAIATIRAHDWPGNVRELQNSIRHAVVLHDGPLVTAAMLPAYLAETAQAAPAPRRAGPDPSAMAAAGPIRPLAEVERDAIEAALEHCNGNVPRAAALLEISPSTIYRKRNTWAEEDLLES